MMGTTRTPHLIAQASVPVAAPTPVPTQPPDPAATAFDWTGVILPALGISAIVGALVKYLDSRQIAKERRLHDEAMHQRQADIAKEMKHLETEHKRQLEEERRHHDQENERRQELFSRIDAWRDFLAEKETTYLSIKKRLKNNWLYDLMTEEQNNE